MLLLIYAPLAGAAAPVTRAAVMLAFGLAAATRLGGERRADPLSLCAAAFVLESLAHPAAAAQLGVKLSYLATLGLLLGPRLGAGGTGASADLMPPGWVRASWRVFLRIARRGLAASISATLATLPVVAAAFGEIAPAGIVLTPLAVPLVATLLASLALGALAPTIAPTLPAELSAEWLLALLRFADTLPGTPIALPPRPLSLLAVAAWGWLLVRRLPNLATDGLFRRGLAKIPLLATAILLAPWSARSSGLEVVLLDVGHGTCLVARGPGLPALVLDAGSRDRPRVASEALAPLLASWDVPRPWVVLSHNHRDHSAALDWLVERRPPEVFGGAIPARLSERIPHDTRRIDPQLGAAALRPYPELRLFLLRGSLEEGNEGSRAVVLDGPDGLLVFLGDSEGPGLASLLKSGLPTGPVEVLLLPHHGSDTPYLGPLLERLRPVETWVSSGGEPAVARELDRRGLRWRRTGAPGGHGACFLLFPAVPGAVPSPRPAGAWQDGTG